MNQEVLKLALEWAEAHGEIVFAGGGMDAVNKMNSWATAIKEALRENAMREVQRLGQEIEQEPVAYINVEKRRLEFAEPMVWHTPTIVKLERIPLYTHQRKSLSDDLYNELLFAVGNKYPNETRHQTALRYILQAEKGDEKAAHGIKDNT